MTEQWTWTLVGCWEVHRGLWFLQIPKMAGNIWKWYLEQKCCPLATIECGFVEPVAIWEIRDGHILVERNKSRRRSIVEKIRWYHMLFMQICQLYINARFKPLYTLYIVHDTWFWLGFLKFEIDALIFWKCFTWKGQVLIVTDKGSRTVQASTSVFHANLSTSVFKDDSLERFCRGVSDPGDEHNRPSRLAALCTNNCSQR